MKKPQFTVSAITDKDFDILFNILARTLLSPREYASIMRELIAELGIENLRAVRLGKDIIGGLTMDWWGHFFGGKSVPTVGIRGVGVDAPYRRIGAASALLAETLNELSGRGVALSTLYASNIPLYRKAGFECAMERWIFTTKLKEIRAGEKKLNVALLKESDRKIIENIYRQYASTANGCIDRNPIIWNSIFDRPWLGECSAYLIKNGPDPEGYVVFYTKTERDPLIISDYAVLTRDAAMTLLALIADHSSMLDMVRWSGGSVDLLTQLLPDRRFEIPLIEPCLLRIVSVESALEARGYPFGIEGRIQLDISDDLIASNNGTFLMTVRDGQASVDPLKKKTKPAKSTFGPVTIDIRTLAQLYTGYLSPWELKLAGMIDGSPDALAFLSTLFSGSRPWLRDHF